MIKKVEKYDFRYDFAKVETIFVEEMLDQEDLDEGLVPEIYDIKVCFSSHAKYRADDDGEREVEWEEIQDLLLACGDKLLNLRNQEVFNITTKDKTLAIIGNGHYQDSQLSLIVHTVIKVHTFKKGGLKRLSFRDIDRTISV